MRIVGYEPQEVDNTIVRIDYWYDWSSRNWVAQKKNSRGDQIGDAIYRYSKKEIMSEVKDLKEEYGVPAKHLK